MASTDPAVLRYAAFTADPAGGNPAGVVLDATGLDDAAMQAIATEVDYAETAFLVGVDPDGARVIRYFSPIAEVPFCGHATIATAVALAERDGPGTIRFRTPVGEVSIGTTADASGASAAFTSVEPVVVPLPDADLDRVLALLGLGLDDLDEAHPPRLAAAGSPHPVLVLRDAAAFDGFTFDPAEARALMDERGWPATIAVFRKVDADDAGGRYEARNVFPVGRITEDPATGSAAAAFGGYLRALGLVDPPARVVIAQGRHVGRPGELVVDVPAAGGVVVTGRAVPIG
ncbi:PhzF family phenazine biosynthesis protein [Agromyces sp. MMS24-K17]|uniref:PhzF family phenazine biosynthesis protein n=1 Tax=Agromyces sp. MMS24-K17 TaxID=3372850 RepID=UPI003753F188